MGENSEVSENDETGVNTYDLPWMRETLSRKNVVSNLEKKFMYNDYIQNFI